MSRPIIASANVGKAMRVPTNNGTVPLPTWAMHHTTLQTPFLDDCCEEYVPLSQEPTPVENVSFVGMLSDAMMDTPLSSTKRETSPNQDNLATPKPSIEEVVVEKGKGPKSTKRPRAAAVMWDDATTHTLIRVYEQQWVHINRGNLRSKDWEDITFSLNKEMNGSFNSEQCRNRIDTLKKVHKKELLLSKSTGSTPSKWTFFEICEALWGATPKCTGLKGALDSDGRRGGNGDVCTEAVDEEVDDIEIQVDATTSPIPTPNVDTIDLDGVVGKKVKQSKRSSIASIARSMDNSMDKMCAMMEKVEEKRNATLRDLEMSRLALEERLAQMQVNMQLEMAKIFARRDH